jgi:hypothetical protein
MSISYNLQAGVGDNIVPSRSPHVGKRGNQGSQDNGTIEKPPAPPPHHRRTQAQRRLHRRSTSLEPQDDMLDRSPICHITKPEL